MRSRSFLSIAAKAVAVLALLAAWTLTAHFVFSDGSYPRLAILFAWAPIASTLAWLTRASAYRAAWLSAIIAATVLILFVMPARDLDPGLVWQLQYLAMQLALGWLFGRTLLQGREPLVTRIARIVHGGNPLPPPIVRYTRQVTLAWTAFFALLGLVATLLYAIASREAWSAFVNLLTVPALLAMFVVEYAIRRLRFPWYEHSSILAGAQAFRRAFKPRDPPA
ncbi:MAG: hypothetical protein ABI624_07885 [Casimicrobiaceae bacterium]